MKTSDDLFQLIKSLDKNEKRYFKLYTSFHSGEKKYVKLFDAIEHQKEYDEEQILQLFIGKESFNQISVAKNYLYHLILKSLRLYNSGKSFDSELREMLDHVEVLYKKGLYKHCFKIIAKAKLIADTREKHALIFEILRWEEKILLMDTNNILDRRAKLLEETNEAIDKFKNSNNYLQLSSQLWILFWRKGKARSQEELNEFNVIYKNAILKDESGALSVESKLAFYNAHIFYARATGDYEKAYSYCKKAVQHIESNSIQMEDEPYRYVGILLNFLIVLGELKRSDEFSAVSKKIKSFVGTKRIVGFTDKVMLLSCYAELTLYVYTGEFKKGVDLVKEVENIFKTSRDAMTRYWAMIFYFEIAKVYFGIEDYKTSLHWMNKALNDPEAKEDLNSFFRIFNLILHYELRNDDIFDNMIRSIVRDLSNRKKLYKVEAIILKFIKKLPSVNTKEELIESFIELKKQLLPLEKDPFEKLAFEEFDIISWLESKIEKRPFAEVVRGKLKRN